MPLPAIIPPLIAAVSPMLQSFIQNRMNRNMSEYTYSKDLAMWEKQNEYNSPKNQMFRLGQAGLNPNLSYSQASTGNAASMPKYTPAQREVKMPDAMAIITQYQNFELQKQKIDLLKEQIELAKANTYRTDLNARLNDPYYQFKFPGYVNGEYTDRFFSPGENKINLAAYQTTAQEMKNKALEDQNRMIAAKRGITENQLAWLKLKYRTMVDTNVNIDKSAVWERMLADIFGEPIKKFSNFAKSKIAGNIAKELKDY